MRAPPTRRGRLESGSFVQIGVEAFPPTCLVTATMSRILAALHAQDDEDDPVNVDFLQPDALAGNKRRWDDQTGPGPSSTPGSGNKRRASGTPREQLNRLPSGLLASTQSPGECLSIQ